MRCFPRLVVLKKEGTSGSIYPFPTGRCSVGGLSTCDIRIPSAGKSHCLVIVDKNSQAHIVNVDGSSVEINGIHVENEAFVNHKDLIKIGAKSFRFEWFSKQKNGTTTAAEVRTDDDELEGAKRESSTLENGAGDQLHTDQESHGTPESNGTQEPHGTPAASTSSASFLDQSVYKTPHIPPEEFVSPLTAAGSNDTSRQSQGASTSKGSLKRVSVKKGSGQSANPVKRLSWSDTPHRSDQEPSENLSRSRGRRPNSSLFVTPSQGLRAEDYVQAVHSNGRPSDSVPSTTSTPLIDEPRIRAMRLRGSMASVEGTPSVASTSVRSDTDVFTVDASLSSHSGAKEQHAPHTSPMKKSARGRSSVLHNSNSSSGEDSFAQFQDAATPSTSNRIFAASTPVVPLPLGAGHVSNGVRTRTRSLSHQTKSNTAIYETLDSSQSFFDTSTGSSGVLSFADGHSSSATPLQTPRANVPRKSSNVSSGSIGHRLLCKTPTQSLGSGNMDELDPSEESPPDASGSSGDGKVPSQNGHAMESKVPGSLEQNSSSTPRVQRKRKEAGLSMKSSPDCDEQAQKGSRASRTSSDKGRGVETPAKKGHEDESFEHKNTSPKANHPSRAGSSKKSSGGLEELGSPSASSRISRAHAVTASNGCKEATHQEMAQKSVRSTRSGSLPGPSAVVEKGESSHQEVDSPAKTPTADRVPTPEDFSHSPVVALQKLPIPPRMTRASCTPLSAKANKDAVVTGDRKSLTGATAAKKSGTSNGLDEASGVDHSESSMELSHGVDGSLSSKKNTRASSGHASTNVKEAEATEPEVAQKSFRGRSSSAKALKAHDEAEDAQQGVSGVSIKTPKTDWEKPSDSPATLARSSRGSRMSASGEDKAEAEEAVKRSRKSVAGARASNRPDQEQEITTALEKRSSSAVAGSSRGSRTPASANDGTREKGTAVKNARESLAGHRGASEHALKDGANSEHNNSVSLPATTPKAKRQQSFVGSDSPVVARSSRGSRTSASDEGKDQAAEKDAVKKSRGTSVGAGASNRPEEDDQEKETTTALEKPSSLAVAGSSRGSRTPAVKNARESPAGRRAASEHALKDDDNSKQSNGASLPATTPKAKRQQSFVGSDSPVIARSSRGSRMSSSGEGKAEAAEKDAFVKKSSGTSVGDKASNRPEEDKTREQGNTAGVEVSGSSAVTRSSRGSRTPASTDDGTREKGTAVKNARESFAGRRAASGNALKDNGNSEHNDSVSLPATAPNAKRQHSVVGSDSPVVARSSRGSRTSASDEGKAEAAEKDTGKKSRGTSVGARASNRPEEDEAQEKETATALEKPSSLAVAGSSRGSRTPASTNDGTQEKEKAVKNARESSAGHRAASEHTLTDGDNLEQSNGVSLPAATPKTKRQQSFVGSDSPVARSSRGSRMSASDKGKAEAAEKDAVVKKSRGTSNGDKASNRLDEDKAQEQGNTAGVEKPSRSSRGSRTAAATDDGSPEKGTAVKNARESLAGRRQTSNVFQNDRTEETGRKLPATTPKSISQGSIEKPSVSPPNARSTRGSRTPASDDQATVVERSRASTAGLSTAPKSRPEDEAQKGTTTVPVKTPKAGRLPSSVAELVTPSRGTRATHTPASTKKTRQTLQQEISPGGSRRSQVGHTDALNVTKENETSECVNMSEKTPKAGNQQIKNGAASSTKGSRDAHLNVSGSSTAESPKAVPKSRGSRSANTPASKDTLGEDETAQHDFVDVATKTPKNKSEKDSSVSTAQSPTTEQPTRVSRRMSAYGNVREDNDLQKTASTSQSFKAEQPTGGSRASRESGSKKELEKQALHSEAPVKAGTSKGGRTPVLKKRSGENIALTQGTGCLREKSVATPTSSEVQGGKSQIPEPSPRATRSSSTPVLKRPSQESRTPCSKKEACIVGKDPCSPSQIDKHGQASNQEPQQSDANTEQPADSASKRRHPRHGKSAGTDPGHLDNAEGTETATSAKKFQKVVAVSFGNEQIANEFATLEAAQGVMQSRAKRATASKKHTATPDKRQQDETAAAQEMTTSRKTRGKRALASQLEASENQQNTEENTACVPAKRIRGVLAAATASGHKVDQEGSSMGTTKVAQTTAPGSELKAEGPSDTPSKKRRGRPAAAISTSGDQGGTVTDLPVGKTRGKRAAASESELNTEESTVGVPGRKKRGGQKPDQSDMAEGSSSGQTKTTQASGSELNSAEDSTDVPAKRKRGGRIAASTSVPKADQDHVLEGMTTKASGTELNPAEDTADNPAKRKRAGRGAASASVPEAYQVDMAAASLRGKTAQALGSDLNPVEDTADVPAKRRRAGRGAASALVPEADQADMAGGSSTGKPAKALGSELNPVEDTANLPAKRKRGGRVAASASGPKVDSTDMAESSSTGKTAQASGSELNSAQDTADVPAKRKRGGRVAASTSGQKVDDQDGVAEVSMGKTKALQEAAAGTTHGAEAKTSSRATRTVSARQKKTAEAEPVPGEHPAGQAALAAVDGEESATGSAVLGRSRRKGATAGVESLPPTASTPKKTRGRRAKPLDIVADEEETGEPVAVTSAEMTEPRTSKRATRRKV